MRSRALPLILAAACVHGHKARDRDTCGAPVPATGERPGRQVVQAQTPGEIRQLSISRDGVVASLAADHGVALWDLASRHLLADVPLPDDGVAVGWADGHVEADVPGAEVEIDRDGTAKRVPRVSVDNGDGSSDMHAWLAIESPATAPTIEGTWHFENHHGTELRLAAPLAGTSVLALPDGIAVIATVHWVLSGDRKHLATWTALVPGNQHAVVWTLGAARAEATVVELPGHHVRDLALSTDGSLLYVTATPNPNDPMKLYTVDLAGRASAVARLLHDPQRIAPSPDGRHLVIDDGDTVDLLGLPSMSLEWSRRLPPSYHVDPDLGVADSAAASALAMTADGAQLLVARTDGSIFALDPASGRVVGRFGWPVRQAVRLRFLDDQHLGVIGQDHLTVWSLPDAAPIRQLELDHLRDVRFDSGDLLALRAAFFCGQGALAIDRWTGWSPPEELDERANGPTHPCDDERTGGALQLVPDARGVAVQDVEVPDDVNTADIDWSDGLAFHWDHATTVVDLADDKEISIPPDPDGLFVPKLSGGLVGEYWSDPDQHLSLHLYDPRTGALVANLPTSTDLAMRFTESDQWFAVHPGGDRVAISDLGAVAELDSSGTIQWHVAVTSEPSVIAYAPDGAVVFGTVDGGLGVVRDGKLVGVGSSDGGSIDDVAIAPGSAIAVTRSTDGGLRVWDLATARLRATLVEFTDDDYIAYLPDGSYSGTEEAARRLAWVFDRPTEAFAFEQFTQFDRPDAVRAALRGDAWTPMPATLLRPPRVTIDVPVTGTSQVTVSATAASSTRVDRVRVYADGRPVAEGPVCTASGRARFDVPLLPGTNRLTAVAYDDRGQSSNQASADVVAPTSTNAPSLWIVAVGVSAYPHLDAADQLGFADDDARALAAGLAAHAKPRYRDVHSTVLTDHQVTHDALLAALAGLDQMGPDDLAVVLLAGHGAKPSDSEDMRFLTSEATFDDDSIRKRGIGWSDIASALARAKGRVLVLLDACHSGHISQEVVVPNDALAASLAGQSRAGVVVVAAAKGRQLSFEPDHARAIGMRVEPAPHVAEEHGLFTAAVLAALDDPSTDLDRDGAIDLSELVDAVETTVDRETRGAQTPWLVRTEVVGDFAIVDAAP